jgi:DNA invertase Pin-like site-specific DNA recombinase
VVAARSGWQVVGLYEDAGISGAKGRDKRPSFDRLLKDATAHKINMIAAGPSIGSAAACKTWLPS